MSVHVHTACVFHYRGELVAHGRNEEQIAGNVMHTTNKPRCTTGKMTSFKFMCLIEAIGADFVIYNDLSDLEASIRSLNPLIQAFDTSCFSGEYVTPEVRYMNVCVYVFYYM